MEPTAETYTVTERTEERLAGPRPGLAELAGLDAGVLASHLELALLGVGARPVSPFDSAI
ncbi:hypothetical protein ACIPYS_12795 [Kitasatospora sp. NPDC089913]|uniref:hypothetical protein n=1 Tax=Streptomycetaceae TaxID=2062 RepID=UPI00087A1C87|nr:hypothetical protein [Streptomyces sp. TLI_053]SDT67386.1 hypothetical protein SAMN05216371_3590 [Streptomyces sp. TLI_053]